MDHLSRLAPILQELLTSTADQLARETAFVQRQRKVSGSNFAQALLFSFLADSRAAASRILGTAAAVGLEMTRQSLEQRYTPACAEFLKRLLAAATTSIVQSPVSLALFHRFTTIEVLDSSIVALPAALAEVFRGGRSGTTQGDPSSVKLTVGLDLKSGALSGPELADGRAGDLKAALAQAGPPRGGLQLADLGYFCLEKFRRWNHNGAYWLSRLKLHTLVRDNQGQTIDLLKRLRSLEADDLDIDVHLGAENSIDCRLIARSVPSDVVRKRRQRLREEARRRGEPVSDRALELARWTILVTNISRDLLSVEEAMELVRLRWQIELVFKLWKSHGEIDEWSTSRSDKVLCGMYAKLLAMTVQHWMLVAGCWQYADRSLVKAARVIQALGMSLAMAIRDRDWLERLLKHASAVMKAACRMESTRGSPIAHERIRLLVSKP